MADLDEISVMIGEIRSDVKHSLRWFDEHEKKDQERYDALAKRIDSGAIAVARIERVEDDIIVIKPVVADVKKLKWVAAGFVMALGLAGGAVGSIATNAMKWFS
jgi:hypothetical protein